MARPKKDEKDKHLKMSVSFPPELVERVCKYCQAEERSISYCVRKSLDKWLQERGY